MESKCVLLKAFGDVWCISSMNQKSWCVDEIVNTIYIISGSFDQKKFEHKTSSVAIEKGTGKLLMIMHW